MICEENIINQYIETYFFLYILQPINEQYIHLTLHKNNVPM
jgi:hypothetical protein